MEYPHYPVSSQPRPQLRRPTAALRAAVALMLAGAVASLGAAIAAAATKDALRLALARSPAHPAGSTLTTTANAMTVMAAVLGVISVGLWLLLARGCWRGSQWARITGTVLFGLDTLGLLIGPLGLHAPGSSLPKVFSSVVWLIGAGTVALLWQKNCTGFFREAGRLE
jgi:MFS superfamily sulfate permease-like transporter